MTKKTRRRSPLMPAPELRAQIEATRRVHAHAGTQGYRILTDERRAWPHICGTDRCLILRFQERTQ